MNLRTRALPWIVTAVLAVAVFGCGGRYRGSGSPNATGGTGGTGTSATGGTSATTSTGTTTTGSLSPAAITGVLNAADDEFSGLVAATSDHDARNARMDAWLKTRPEFSQSGVTAFDSVWGVLKNGQLYVATSTFIPGETRTAVSGRGATLPTMALPEPAPRSVRTVVPSVTRAGAALELPKAAQARVLLSLDKGFYDPPNDTISGLLRDRDYTVLQQTATVANLKHVQGDGAFYWGTHGTIAYDPATQKGYWAAWSADDVTDANNAAFKADLDAHSLVYFAAAYKVVGGETRIKTHYAITAKFIDEYDWTLADHAFVFMNCCHSDNGAISIDIANRAASPGGAFGWSGSVLVGAAWKAGEFAFDRLLGANEVAPKEPVPQRPFDSQEVYYDMKDRGLDDGGGATRLKSLVASPPSLAPSIQRMEMAERIRESPLGGKTKLTLYGIFGDDKGTVKVGGVEVPVTTWKTDKVECQPADRPGPGFAGDVLVVSHARTSNTVPLTEWHGKLTYTIDILPPQASNAVSEIACDVYFRGDVHRYRENAGRGPLPPKAFDFRASQGSTGKWKVTGDPLPASVWSGPLSATLPFGLNGTANPPYGTGYIVSGRLDQDAGAVRFSFSFLGCVAGYVFPGTPTGGTAATIHDPMLTSTGSGVGSDGYVVYANNLPATIDATDFTIPGGTLLGSTPVFSPKLVWTTFVPSFMPDPSKGEDDGR